MPRIPLLHRQPLLQKTPWQRRRSKKLKNVNANSVPIPDSPRTSAVIYIALADLAKSVTILQRLCDQDNKILKRPKNISRNPVNPITQTPILNKTNSYGMIVSHSRSTPYPIKRHKLCGERGYHAKKKPVQPSLSTYSTTYENITKDPNKTYHRTSCQYSKTL